MTSAQLWAQTVNSRFSMAKHYHVFSAAEACKHCWLGVGGVFGPGSIYFSFPEEALSLSLALRLSESAWDEGSVARPLLT